MKQKLVWGAGGAWLAQHYPGASPARRRPGLVWWGVRTATTGLLSSVWARDRDGALKAFFEPLEQLLYEFGRSLPNERPLPGASLWRRVAGRSHGYRARA